MKNITTGNEKHYEKLSLFRSHGITRNVDCFQNREEGIRFYEQKERGYNYRLSDIQCALGKSQLKRLPIFLKKRLAIAELYNDAFKEIGDITLSVQGQGCISSWHLYVIQVEAEKRQDVFNRLREKGIGVNVHYIPVYKHPYYRKNGYANICCENAEKLYQRIISMPIHPQLTKAQQQYVIKNVEVDFGNKNLETI